MSAKRRSVGARSSRNEFCFAVSRRPNLLRVEAGPVLLQCNPMDVSIGTTSILHRHSHTQAERESLTHTHFVNIWPSWAQCNFISLNLQRTR